MELNRQNYAEFFLLYIDGELHPDQRKEAELFLEQHPDLKQELELLKQVTFAPDKAITFGDKSTLYKKEERERRIIPFNRMRMAAAAAVFLALGIISWFYFTPRQHTDAAMNVAQNNGAINAATGQKNTPPAKATGALSSIQEKATPVKRRKENHLPDITVKDNRKQKAVPSAPVEPPVAASGQNTAPAFTAAQRSLPHAQPETSIVVVEAEKKNITSSVAAFTSNAGQFEGEGAQQRPHPVVHDFTDDENNNIYFANAALPKRTKFREVLRKASRVLGRVASGSGDDLLRKNDMVRSTQ